MTALGSDLPGYHFLFFLSCVCIVSFVRSTVFGYLSSSTGFGCCSFNANRQQSQNVDQTNLSFVREK